MEKEPMFFVVNPRSAGGRTLKRWNNTEVIFQNLKIPYQKAYTSITEDAACITRMAIKEGYRHIIAVGGDGTVNEVLNGFYENGKKIADKVYFSILSTGTGSDFQRMFNKNDLNSAVQGIINREKIMHCDIIRVTYDSWAETRESRYYVNSADLGIGAETCMRVNRGSKYLGGFLTFIFAVLGTLIMHKNFAAEVWIDGINVFSGYTPEIVAANGRFYGGGVMIAPEAEINDGLLDVLIIEDISKGKFLRTMPSAYRGEHIRKPYVKQFKGRHVQVICSPAVLLETDGETPGTSNASFEVLPGDILMTW